jgi:hypothetical protein
MAGRDKVPGRLSRPRRRAPALGRAARVLAPGAAVSSAILYLAIIAIWAVFLVPAWVRRPHARTQDSAPETELSYGAGQAEAEPGEYPAETAHEVDVGTRTDVHFEASEYSQDEYEYYEVEYREEQCVVAAGYAPGEYDTEPRYGDQEFAVAAGEPGPSADVASGPGEYEHGEGNGAAEAGPSQSREQMLRARRRMLAILAGMTLVTMTFTALGLVSWWICIPPAGLLALYVLLLREIARADAKLARKRSGWEQTRAVAYERHMQAVAEREAYEASLPPPPEPQAEIIDISGRVADADQLYDQYADAAVRAVGD